MTDTRFKPGVPRLENAGRKKGIPNKATVALKDMILGALADAGGQAYLCKQALETPGPFLALVGKVLPTTLAGDPNSPLRMELTVAARAAEDRRKIGEAEAIIDAAFEVVAIEALESDHLLLESGLEYGLDIANDPEAAETLVEIDKNDE